eukprot:TRINITY_DN31164_c0_g1_i4.p1 TRINITY_DN31164_c0_g1~~TRINITY_DN31164_c0_g1_i4.p1  ORF type:complete len:189 (+),score=-20.29 TRINITY_DN31164_c0_g1_i4:353-919(+)
MRAYIIKYLTNVSVVGVYFQHTVSFVILLVEFFYYQNLLAYCFQFCIKQMLQKNKTFIFYRIENFSFYCREVYACYMQTQQLEHYNLLLNFLCTCCCKKAKFVLHSLYHNSSKLQHRYCIISTKTAHFIWFQVWQTSHITHVHALRDSALSTKMFLCFQYIHNSICMLILHTQFCIDLTFCFCGTLFF